MRRMIILPLALPPVLLLAMKAVVASAQEIPIRQLGPAEATASIRIDALSLVRPLSDDRVVVSKGRRVLVFTPDLSTYEVAVDSTSIAPGIASFLPLAIVAGLGDTTYVVDQGAGGLIIVDPGGKAGRMIAVPKASDLMRISMVAGWFRTYTDPKGRLVYQGVFPREPGPATTAAVSPDTFPLVRADFDTRSVDTIAVLRIGTSMRSTSQIDNGRVTLRSVRYAYPTIDVWTMLGDGTVAIVRGSDYHVDWIRPDGSRSATPKMPFDWRRLTDDDKARITDSLQVMTARMVAREDSMRRAAGAGTSSITRIQEVAPANELPDYYPPVRDGAARPDADGNLWVLPTTSASARGGLLYDVVNRKGQILERVQLPGECALAGFAKDRRVFLICTSTSLERRRILN
jgi:hypothetical protein